MIRGEIFPGQAVESDADLVDHCRRTVKTNYHPVGTCRMGTEIDALAVVTPDLVVRGIAGLRIVDASIMPTIPSGNTNAPVLAIADKAVDIITGHSRMIPAPTAAPSNPVSSVPDQVHPS
jgi:choline dehydrogenase